MNQNAARQLDGIEVDRVFASWRALSWPRSGAS